MHKTISRSGGHVIVNVRIDQGWISKGKLEIPCLVIEGPQMGETVWLTGRELGLSKSELEAAQRSATDEFDI